jgi:hypothetical protein
VEPKVKAALLEIWKANTCEAARQAFVRKLTPFEAKYPKAMDCLAKDRDELLAFYATIGTRPGRALGAHPHHQPDRVDLLYGALAHQALAQLRLARDDARDGLQAAAERAEALEAHQGIQETRPGVNNVQFRNGEQIFDQSDRTAPTCQPQVTGN